MNVAQELLPNLITALRDKQQEEYETLVADFPRGEAGATLWKAIGEAHGSAFDLFERLLAWPMMNTSVAVRRLMPAVEFVSTLAHADAIRFLQFAERVEPSLRHIVAKQLTHHIALTPELGRQLGESLRLGKVQGDGATRVWAGAFWDAAPQQAAAFTLHLVEGVDINAALLAITLQYLPAESDVVAPLRPQESKLATALLEAVPTLGGEAWFAVTAIAGFSKTAMDALEKAIEIGEVPALIAAANWLYKISTPRVGATGVALEEVVGNLLRHAVANGEVRQSVDSGVSSLLYRDALRGVVLDRITELGKLSGDAIELFKETFDAVCDKPEDFTSLLTEWLVTEGIALGGIRDLLSRCNTQQAPADLDCAIFTAAPPARKVAAMRRLMAMTHNGPVLCLFIASLAETPAMQPQGLELATHMLNETFSEYPAATEEFLRSRTRPGTRHEPFAHVYRGVYANALQWRRVLSKLPKRNELRPTDSQHHALRSLRQRINRDIIRMAEKRSIFAFLSTKMHVAQGRRFTSHSIHGVPQLVEMQQMSHSVELPSSELADPVGGMLRRAGALAAGR
jgi:hypothetical protein